MRAPDPVRDVFYMGMLRETTGGEQFSHAGGGVLPIDSKRALRAAGVFICFVADLDRRPRSPTLLCALPPRRRWRQVCAVCRFAAVPALCHVSPLTQHAAVACVLVLCVIVPSESTLAARAA